MIVVIDAVAADHGRTIHDDGVVRAADLGNDLYLLQAGGNAVEFGLSDIATAADRLARMVPGCRSFAVEAGRAILDDVAERLPADG